jgi:hypothetical protein
MAAAAARADRQAVRERVRTIWISFDHGCGSRA